MIELKRTVFHSRHTALKARMVDFEGWGMPVFYPTGIIAEHLATRRRAGLFDVSHMGRFIFRGEQALEFLQYVLTNNAAALDTGQAQYTVMANEQGGAVDDAYLYRFRPEEYLLVVNASNRQKDWDHLQSVLSRFSGVEINDRTEEICMLALQGPWSRKILLEALRTGALPEPRRNALSIASLDGAEVLIGRTGYTGEPLCFELFTRREDGPALWDRLIEQGATPVGLGARDTLRLEAALPLYGHEFGLDPDGREIPILAFPLAKMAVSFSPLKSDYFGRTALFRQHQALEHIQRGDFSYGEDLPRIIRPVTMLGRGVARAGDKVFKNDKPIGYVTSGTTVPYWRFEGQGLGSVPTGEHKLRTVALALLDSRLKVEDRVCVEIRGKMVEAVIVPYHLRSDSPPYARPVLYGVEPPAPPRPRPEGPAKARRLIDRALANHRWRRRECINLIPSEMTVSPLVRLLSVTDPAHRYAEHRKSASFHDAEIFYYQGTEFIAEVESLLEEEFKQFLGCPEVETRLISGQMANTAVFSALVDYLNRTDRKKEPRRIARVMNNHLGKGGHLSAQPMGALKDYVARDPRTERPAVVNFPVQPDNPYRIDLPETLNLIDEYRPELIIFGKSMVLHPEPVAAVRAFLDREKIASIIMYDMAHVLGLVGPHFQQPFEEGADVVTGSTHKTFFGTQRGLVGAGFRKNDEGYHLWEALRRRTFPGSVSNHHLGTMLGLLMAAYEMNHFKDEYQPRVLKNAKALARALKDCGLDVAGDPAVDFTETHQVVVEVGYAQGPEIARRLEENNIIVNYQAAPGEEGFTAAGALRLGVAEMTRFGFGPAEFQDLAQLMKEVILNKAPVKDKVISLRQGFIELQYCFKGRDFEDLLSRLAAEIGD